MKITGYHLKFSSFLAVKFCSVIFSIFSQMAFKNFDIVATCYRDVKLDKLLSVLIRTKFCTYLEYLC